MFALVNGRPIFYLGYINDTPYTSQNERQEVIDSLDDKEYTEREVKLDEDYKAKCIELGERQLTYSKGKFLQLLENGVSNITETDVTNIASKLDSQVKKKVNENKDLGEEAIIDLHIRTSNSVDKLSEINELTQKALLDLHARVVTALDEIDSKLKQLDI